MTAERARISFYVDWDDDGDFDDANEDISAYIQSASWSLGFQQALQAMADEPQATLELVNTDRRFSPEYTAGPLYGLLKPQRRVRLDAEANVLDADGAIVVTEAGDEVVMTIPRWTGYIESLAPTPMQYSGPFMTTLHCAGVKRLMEAAEIELDLLEDVTGDTAIEAILDAWAGLPATLAGSWRLGVSGSSELGLTTYLANAVLPYTLDVGLVTFPYVGDNWDRFSSVYDALATVVVAERGKLWFDYEGQVVFWNRTRFQLDETVRTLFDNTMVSLDYRYGDDIVNDVRVTCYPRALSATNNDVLWELDEPLTLRPDQTRTVRARYTAGEGQQVGARDVQTPTGADFVAEAGVSMTLFTAEARSASIELLNSSKQDQVVTTLVVRGQKITTWNAQEIEEIDGESIGYYGRRVTTIDLPLLVNDGFARNIAEYELMRRSAPRGQVTSMTLVNRDPELLGLQLGLDIGDRVTIAETQTAHSGDYFIVGEQCEWRDAGERFTTRYAVEEAPVFSAWVLGRAGRSELGLTTYLGL